MGSRKIKRRTRGKDRIVKMTPAVADAVQRQIDKFREKFGREPGKDDPLFFDEDCFLPRPMDLDAVTSEAVEAMKLAGIRPELIYAFQRTGLIVTEENIDKIPKSALAEWSAVIEQFRAMTDTEPDEP